MGMNTSYSGQGKTFARNECAPVSRTHNLKIYWKDGEKQMQTKGVKQKEEDRR